MIANRVTAVFEAGHEAAEALGELRRLGVRDSQLSVLTRQPAGGGGGPARVPTGPAGRSLERAAAGATRLYGLDTVTMPGRLPYMAGGALASAIGAIGASAIGGVNAGGGSLEGALDRAGYPLEAARFYVGAIERGGVFVTVDGTFSPITTASVRDVLSRHGGLAAPVPG